MPFEIVWEGQRYVLAESGFYNARTFLKAPETVQQHLKSAYVRQLQQASENDRNPTFLLNYSGIAKNLGYLDLALKFVQRVLEFEPRNVFAVAKASSMLRKKGQPQKALAVTNRIPENQQGHVLLTTRAAALCDLGRYHEAMTVIRRALALLRGRRRSKRPKH
jgi:tetratricopeptide (TPR) repeat protein